MRSLLLLVIACICLTGCSHNSSLLMAGKKASIGIDPQSFTVNAAYADGFSLGDVSRENSEWEIEIDDSAGLQYDSKSGNIKGIKRIKRKLGPQITGYLVDLAEADPETARKYMESLKAYWGSQNELNSGGSE